MPSPLVKSLSAKLNISVDKVEAAWKKAKAAAADSLKKPVTALEGDDFKIVTTITKRMLGVKEAIDIKSFLKSGKSAKEFVEDMISTGAGIGHTLDTVVIPPKKPMAQPKDDDNYDEDEEDLGTVFEHPNEYSKAAVRTVALGNTKKAVKPTVPQKPKPREEKLDIYQNFSKIGKDDFSQIQVVPEIGGFTETAQIQAGKLPASTVTTAPITQLNRSRLDPNELKEMMSQPMSSPADAMRPAPFSVVADAGVVDRPPLPDFTEGLMEDLANIDLNE